MKLHSKLVLITTAAAILTIAWLLGSPRPLAAAGAGPSAEPAPASACGGDAALRGFFKGAPAGMKAKDKVERYDEPGLFNYIDGGAPLYIKHHFRRLAAAELRSDSGGELTCDIYDMNGATNAAAIFAAEKSASFKPVAGWPHAATGPMFFIFHQGCYYVKLTAFDKKAESALPALAGALRERMRGAPPTAPSRKP